MRDKTPRSASAMPTPSQPRRDRQCHWDLWRSSNQQVGHPPKVSPKDRNNGSKFDRVWNIEKWKHWELLNTWKNPAINWDGELGTASSRISRLHLEVRRNKCQQSIYKKAFYVWKLSNLAFNQNDFHDTSRLKQIVACRFWNRWCTAFVSALWHLSENLQWECTHLFSSCYQWLPKQSGCWWETHSLCMVVWSVIIAWLVHYIFNIYTNLHWLNMI